MAEQIPREFSQSQVSDCERLYDRCPLINDYDYVKPDDDTINIGINLAEI